MTVSPQQTDPAGRSAAPTGEDRRPLEAWTLRTCLGQSATGVAVVTYQGEDEPRGATINSVTSESMEPPLALVAFARSTTAARMLGDRSPTTPVSCCSTPVPDSG
jgi:Flavin reductase like domain